MHNALNFLFIIYIMLNSEDYEITPANQSCLNSTTTVIVSNPGSQISNTQTNVNALQQQQTEYSKYDSPQQNVQPMYGGKKNNKLYNIYFKKKIYEIYANNEINGLKKIFKNKSYKKDYLLNITNNNISSCYIIRSSNKKNKFIKI